LTRLEPERAGINPMMLGAGVDIQGSSTRQ
jgi:hypothetical protein